MPDKKKPVMRNKSNKSPDDFWDDVQMDIINNSKKGATKDTKSKTKKR